MSPSGITVLIVDDERDVREPLAKFLRSQGFDAITASNGVEALGILEANAVAVVVTDLQMPKMGGLELLRRIRAEHPRTEVIIFTAYGTVDGAVDAVKSGAHDYVLKPIIFEDIQQKIERITSRDDSDQPPNESREMNARASLDAIIGSSRAIEKLKDLVSRVARAGSFALIQGESGTGKELVARALHNLSPRNAFPFQAVNCAAVPVHLMESEFFGHTRGSFTGAVANKQGFFQVSDCGTLFLDEVGELPLEMQTKLLRAIEEREIMPIGQARPIAINLTIVAASARILRAEVEAGRFREDLFHRINVVEINVPPLRDRRDDIPLLAKHFLDDIGHRVGASARGLSLAAMASLQTYRWPGNVRELRNVVERAALVCDGDEIIPADLPDHIGDGVDRSDDGSAGYRSAVRGFEKELIQKTLANCNYDKKLTAKVLGIGLSSLYRKLEEFEINDQS